MNEANVEVVRRFLQAVRERDLETFIECTEPDCEFVPIMAALEGRVYHGHAAMRDWFAEMILHWELFDTLPEEFEVSGDRVVAFGTWRARGRASGVELSNQPATWVAHIRNGRICRWRTYTDRAEALGDLGLSR